MKRILLLLPAFLFAGLLPAQVIINEEWSHRHNDAGDYSDKFNAAALDNAGNVCLAGYTVTEGNSRDFLTVKIDPAGDTLWVRTYDGAGNGMDEALDIATDASGNIFVTGYSKGNGTGDDYLTLKYDPSGALIWSATYNYSVNEDDQANSIAIDASGNIYVTGQSDRDASAVTNDDYLTVKYDPSGVQLWAMRYNGFGSATDRAVKVVTDVAGDVYVTGRSDNGSDDDFVTIKYSSSGTQVWMQSFNNGGNDRAVSMTIDNASNIYITGRSDNGNDDDIRTIKYSSAGTQLFSVSYSGGMGHDRPTAITTDNSFIYITGQRDIDPTSAKNYNYITIKYSLTGAQQWTANYNGTGNGDDIPSSIAVDGNGNVYVTGQSDGNMSVTLVDNNIATVAYSSSGTQLWVQSVNGSASASDGGNDLVLNAGYLFVAGHVQNNPGQKDAVAIKYNTSGTQQWTRTIARKGDNSDNANTITADNAGNVYVAGYVVEPGNDRDMCTMKLSAVGDTLWVRKYSGTSSLSTDEAAAIAVDAMGYVYVTGYTKNSNTSYDYTTIKYNSAGDTVWVRKYNYAAANGSDKAADIAVDASGNVYVTGESSNGLNSDVLTVKYSSTGIQLWAARYNSTSNADDAGVRLKLGSSGIFVAGRSFNGADDDYKMLKYSTTGALSWQQSYNGGYGSDRPSSMAIDNADNIYVTGKSAGINGTDDYATLKYTSAGSVSWTARYDGTAGSDDRANGIALDKNGNVYVTGQTDVDTSALTRTYDYLTVKYDASGNQLWAVPFSGSAGGDDIAAGVAVDDSDYVYVTGQADRGAALMPNPDFATIKYDPSGNPVWVAYYDGPDQLTDGANVIAVKYNKIYVAGNSRSASTQKDIFVMQYNTFIVGVNEIEESSFALYPNPASDRINIVINGAGEEHAITVSDMQGRTLINEIAGKQCNFNVRDLSPGIYTIGIDQHSYKKLVIGR